MRTLVLNASFEPLHVVSWERAICLIFASKAEVVAEYHSLVRSVSKSIKLPKVIRLFSYVDKIKQFGLAKCTRRNVFARDQYLCQYCGIKVNLRCATLDHVIPRSKGGTSDFLNLVTCCETCNRLKGARDPKQAGMKLLKKPFVPRILDLNPEYGDFSDDSVVPFAS
jgi:5-methylcytosine-specific restriction endonuclease McrA